MSMLFRETVLYARLQKELPGIEVLADVIWPEGGALASPRMIEVPAGVVLSEPIRIETFLDASFNGKAVLPRTILKIGKNAKALVIESHIDQGVGSCFLSPSIEIFLAEGASVEIVRCLRPGAGTFCLSSVHVTQERDSRSRLFMYTDGARMMRDELKVVMNAEGAAAVLNGLHHLTTGVAESLTSIEHNAPHTTSDQLYKCVLDGDAASRFNGRILVRREAQQTNAYQLNKNLLLSETSRAEARPELEIFADDVKCSHGASVGQLNEDEVFYLQTRGIPMGQARRMLIQGFLDDVLLRVEDKQLKAHVNGVCL